MSNPANPSAPPRSGLLWLLVLASLGLVTANVWLLNKSLNDRRQESLERQFWIVSQPGFTAEQRSSAFLALVRQHNFEWASAKLHGLDLDEIQLPGVILSRADFHDTTFRNATLNHADFSSTILRTATFDGANLEQADLNSSDLYRTKMVGVNLKRANLQAAICQEADFSDSDLHVADFSEADLLLAKLDGARLGGANFTSARLEAAAFKNADLSLARLSGADLKDADFTDANWWRARGLASADLARLTKEFSPSTNAPAKLQQDFKAWLDSKK